MSQTAIQKLIAERNASGNLRPVTMRDYMVRMGQLTRWAAKSMDPSGFAYPVDLNQSEMRLISGLYSSRLKTRGARNELDEPVSLVREMLLLCYEAKPRPISLAMTGYVASDLVAYIYQDVAAQEIPDFDPGAPIAERIDQIKMWLRVTPPRTAVNNASRHIRRRLMVMLDRSNHQAASLIEDREMPTEVRHLVQKLLERDDDQGYTNGRLRDFHLVREDLNALAEHCLNLRFDPDSRQIEDLNMVCCPGDVVTQGLEFEKVSIQRRRGKAPSKATKSVKRITTNATPELTKAETKKAATKKSTHPTKQQEVQNEDDLGLDVLKLLD